MKQISTLADDELVRMYQEGNDNAFDVLLSRHQDKVFNYILFLTRNEDKANDVFQDTFVRAITALRSNHYEETGSFGSWLIRISRNLVLDSSRRLHTLPFVHQELVDDKGDVVYDRLNDARYCEPTIEDSILSTESAENLRMMVDRLPENQREIIYLRYYRDISFKEISKILDVSINTALGRVRYAILNLRRMANEHNLSLVG